MGSSEGMCFGVCLCLPLSDYVWWGCCEKGLFSLSSRKTCKTPLFSSNFLFPANEWANHITLFRRGRRWPRLYDMSVILMWTEQWDTYAHCSFHVMRCHCSASWPQVYGIMVHCGPQWTKCVAPIVRVRLRLCCEECVQTCVCSSSVIVYTHYMHR